MIEKLAIDGGVPALSVGSQRIWPFYDKNVEVLIAKKIKNGEVFATNIDKDINYLEESFVNRICPDHLSLFCSSGTSALMTAYFSLGLDYGAEVLVQSNTFRATATPLLLLNLVPVLCCSDESGALSVEDAEKRITSKTQAIVVTHMWGQTTNLSQLKLLATKYNLALVEDCSHAHGVKWNNQPVGTLGDVSIFSLGTKKIVSGGIGGMLITNQKAIFEKAALFSQPKPKANKLIADPHLKAFLSSGLGVNFRGSPLSAILAQNHLDRLDTTIQIKNKNISFLRSSINQFLPELKPISKKISITDGTWYSYPCIWTGDYASRDKVVKALKAEGLMVSGSGDLLHNMELFNQKNFKPPLTTYNIPLFNKEQNFEQLDELFSKLIIWSTTDMYESNEILLERYSFALKKVGFWLKNNIS